MARKRLSKGKEIKKLDALFSKFIRLRDSDSGGYGQCCTCKKLLHWKEAHAGHFIKRGNMLTRFDERNVNLQCCGCNTYREGEQAEHLLYIERKYGRKVVDELMELKKSWNGVGGMGIVEIREKQDYYKKKLKALEQQRYSCT